MALKKQAFIEKKSIKEDNDFSKNKPYHNLDLIKSV